MEARLSEYRNAPKGEELERLREELETREGTRLEAALKRLQSWGADCAGLGARAAMSHPARWERVKEEWPERFRQLPIEVSVNVRINR